MHPSPIRLTAIVGAAALASTAALASLGAAAAPAATAAASPNAQSEYNAAIKAAGSEGVHFSSIAGESGTAIAVTGDVGTTSGAQTIILKKGSSVEHMKAVVVGSTGYVNGNAAGLRDVIGLTSAQSSKYANRWLSFPTSNTTLDELIGGLVNSQVAGELKMSGPYSYGDPSTVQGQHALAIKGTVSTQGNGSIPVTLYVPASGTPLPIEEVTNPGVASSSSAVHGTVVFSHWGEKTHETAPTHSYSLVKLAPSSSG